MARHGPHGGGEQSEGGKKEGEGGMGGGLDFSTFAAGPYRAVVMHRGTEVRFPSKCARVRAVRCA